MPQVMAGAAQLPHDWLVRCMGGIYGTPPGKEKCIAPIKHHHILRRRSRHHHLCGRWTDFESVRMQPSD